MYGIILEFTHKTIKLRNVISEKITYLYSEMENLKTDGNRFESQEKLDVGDILNVKVRKDDIERKFSKTFLRSEYQKVNDGISKFDICLKCENEFKTQKYPLCYTCKESLKKVERISNTKDESRINNTEHSFNQPINEKNSSVRKAPKKFIEMSTEEIVKVNRALRDLAELSEIKEEIVDFSYAKVLDGLTSLGMKLNAVDSTTLQISKQDLMDIDDEFHKSSEIKGILFEIATHKLIEKMKTAEIT